jgi:hypothetical protein
VIDALAKVRRRARAVRAAVTGPTWNHARRPVREK